MPQQSPALDEHPRPPLALVKPLAQVRPAVVEPGLKRVDEQGLTVPHKQQVWEPPRPRSWLDEVVSQRNRFVGQHQPEVRPVGAGRTLVVEQLLRRRQPPQRKLLQLQQPRLVVLRLVRLVQPPKPIDRCQFKARQTKRNQLEVEVVLSCAQQVRTLVDPRLLPDDSWLGLIAFQNALRHRPLAPLYKVPELVQAKRDWQSRDFVPLRAELEFCPSEHRRF